MKTISLPVTGLLLALLIPAPAHAFCGFYVAKGDAKLFNKASQVVLVRNEDKTVLTMANDFKGDLKEFAIVVPVPTVLEKEQIHVGERVLLDRIDAYSAPRLVEYFDSDPCAKPRPSRRGFALGGMSAPSAKMSADAGERARSLGVTIEAQYTVGEYDILILSAKQSGGLETWLREEKYNVPKGASEVLASYLKQGMKFFVAKVNLAEQDKLGFSYLRPIQVAYESPKFMLPIRLGMVNADGAQDLFVYALTKKGRVETTNYRTMKLPTGMDVPVYVKEKFGDFYKDTFATSVKKENMKAVFLEYAWNMNWCDPCAAEPLTNDELRKLGVFWLAAGANRGGASEVFISRLHVRYDKEHFPEDLVFQETADQENYQGRYVLRHPFAGDLACAAGKQYRTDLRTRQKTEAKTLADLTGWNLAEIEKTMKIDQPLPKDAGGKWYQDLWE